MEHSESKIRALVVISFLGITFGIPAIVVLIWILYRPIMIENVEDFLQSWFCLLGLLIGIVFGYYFTRPWKQD